MITVLYLIGFVFYCLSASLSYNEKAKVAPWFFPVGLAMAMIVNFIWLFIAKNSSAGHETFVRGLVWDSMIVGCYVFIPIMFYGVRLTGLAALGAGLIIAGIALTKVA